MDKPKLIIYGASELGGRFAIDYADLGKNRDKFELVGFVDDYKKGSICKFPILGNSKDLPSILSSGIDHILISLLLEPGKRLDICRQVDNIGFKLPSILESELPEGSSIGKGVYVHDSAKISGKVSIGDFSIISAYAHLDNSKIGDGVIMSPGSKVSRNSQIGDATVLYMNAFIPESTSIGKNCIINTNAFVHKNLNSGKIKTYDALRFGASDNLADIIFERENHSFEDKTFAKIINAKARLESLITAGRGYNIPLSINTYIPSSAKIGKGVRIHSTARFIGYNFEIGDFSIIGPRAVIERSNIGQGVVIQNGAKVGYGSSIGDATVLEENSISVPGTIIGRNCIVKEGAIAHRKVKDGSIINSYLPSSKDSDNYLIA
jgi:UDP-3-O-[3-hydroxymyristoyl] glucosamine N-acyltransferase